MCTTRLLGITQQGAMNTPGSSTAGIWYLGWVFPPLLSFCSSEKRLQRDGGHREEQFVPPQPLLAERHCSEEGWVMDPRASPGSAPVPEGCSAGKAVLGEGAGPGNAPAWVRNHQDMIQSCLPIIHTMGLTWYPLGRSYPHGSELPDSRNEESLNPSPASPGAGGLTAHIVAQLPAPWLHTA